MNEIRLDEAYEKWADELVGYATAIVGPADAADVVADVFVSLLAGPGHQWLDVREPRGFLFRCVLNAGRMHIRSGSRRTARERQPVALAPNSGSAERLLADPAVVGALQSLPVQQRAVIYHAYWDDLSPAAIAELLDVSVGTVKRQLARGRARLRKVLP